MYGGVSKDPFGGPAALAAAAVPGARARALPTGQATSRRESRSAPAEPEPRRSGSRAPLRSRERARARPPRAPPAAHRPAARAQVRGRPSVAGRQSPAAQRALAAVGRPGAGTPLAAAAAGPLDRVLRRTQPKLATRATPDPLYRLLRTCRASPLTTSTSCLVAVSSCCSCSIATCTRSPPRQRPAALPAQGPCQAERVCAAGAPLSCTAACRAPPAPGRAA